MAHRGAKRLLAMLLAIAVALGMTVVTSPGALAQGAPASSVSGEQVRAIAEKLQCPVCQGISVADSNSQVAQDMRAIIRAKLEAGESQQQIFQYFKERYGQAILREPPRTGFYSAVWWVPVLAVVLGAGAIFGMTRRSRPGPPQNVSAARSEVISKKEPDGEERKAAVPKAPDAHTAGLAEQIEEEVARARKKGGQPSPPQAAPGRHGTPVAPPTPSGSDSQA